MIALRIRPTAFALCSALMAAGCTGTYSEDTASAAPEEPLRKPVMQCDAQYAQHHIGDKVTQELGLVIREETGAKTLRWGPPNSAWTMDYRQDRVNVRYDETMAITAVTCG